MDTGWSCRAGPGPDQALSLTIRRHRPAQAVRSRLVWGFAAPVSGFVPAWSGVRSPGRRLRSAWSRVPGSDHRLRSRLVWGFAALVSGFVPAWSRVRGPGQRLRPRLVWGSRPWSAAPFLPGLGFAAWSAAPSPPGPGSPPPAPAPVTAAATGTVRRAGLPAAGPARLPAAGPARCARLPAASTAHPAGLPAAGAVRDAVGSGVRLAAQDAAPVSLATPRSWPAAPTRCPRCSRCSRYARLPRLARRSRSARGAWRAQGTLAPALLRRVARNRPAAGPGLPPRRPPAGRSLLRIGLGPGLVLGVRSRYIPGPHRRAQRDLHAGHDRRPLILPIILPTAGAPVLARPRRPGARPAAVTAARRAPRPAPRSARR